MHDAWQGMTCMDPGSLKQLECLESWVTADLPLQQVVISHDLLTRLLHKSPLPLVRHLALNFLSLH